MGISNSYDPYKQDARERAKLRVCASCDWIFSNTHDCPKCSFAHYGARYVYGDKCYRYAKTQQPWLEKKVSNYICKLRAEIKSLNQREVKWKKLEI
jgi:hypothetical protein